MPGRRRADDYRGTATGRLSDKRLREIIALDGVGLFDTDVIPHVTTSIAHPRGARDWPLPNVILGVSVEDRSTMHRINDLRATPAACRMVSFEPLLEDLGTLDLAGISWAVTGGESGPGARPMHPDWPRAIRDQCQAAGVPFCFKQWGGWLPDHQSFDAAPYAKATVGHRFDDGTFAVRVGKHRSGRLLDGRTHDEFPEMGIRCQDQ